MKEVTDIFTDIYNTRKWRSKESISGTGSELASTVNIRKQIPIVFQEFGIKRVLDIGCGDFNWMKEIVSTFEFYVGVDVVSPLIDSNIEKYGSESVRFYCKNIQEIWLERFDFDVVILSDVLVHLPFEEIFSILRKIEESGIPYVLMTNFTQQIENKESVIGGWRQLNFDRLPFKGFQSLFSIPHTDQFTIKALDKTLTLYQSKFFFDNRAPSITYRFDGALYINLAHHTDRICKGRIDMIQTDKFTVMLAFRSGGDFSFADVDLLSTRLRGLFGTDVDVFCFSDKVLQEFKLQNVTMIPTPYPEWAGWWTKLNLFSPELERYRPFLYLDLDTAVLSDFRKDISIVLYKEDFVTLSDFYRPDNLASGMMWIPANNVKIKKVWETWMMGPQNWIKRYQKGDQQFIGNVVDADHYWQKVGGFVSSFKPMPKKKWLATLPKKVSIVCFHGYPRIRQASEKIRWVSNYIKGIE